MNYVTFQRGTLVKRPDANGFTWILRYYDAEGHKKALKLGTNVELPTEADAKRKAASMTAVINDTKDVFTFGQLVERYIKEQLPSRPQTAASYKTCLKYLKDRFSEQKLEAVLGDLVAIEDWLKGLQTQSKPARPLSKKTKSNIKAMLYRLIEVAMKWGYISMQRNPISVVEVKTVGIQPKKRLKRPLTAKQIKDLINYAELPEHVRVMVKLCVFLGLRISETLGLKWEDIDFENVDGAMVSIVRSAVGQHIDETKTVQSNDVLPLHRYLVDTLLAWRKASTSINGWVFESETTGRPFHRDSLQSDYLAPAGRKLGIVNLGWHTLRHTYIKHLRKNKTDAEVTMMLARHADLSTTNLYGRDDEEMDLKRPAHEALVDALWVKMEEEE
jgi:integrase